MPRGIYRRKAISNAWKRAQKARWARYRREHPKPAKVKTRDFERCKYVVIRVGPWVLLGHWPDAGLALRWEHRAHIGGAFGRWLRRRKHSPTFKRVIDQPLSRPVSRIIAKVNGAKPRGHGAVTIITATSIETYATAGEAAKAKGISKSLAGELLGTAAVRRGELWV